MPDSWLQQLRRIAEQRRHRFLLRLDGGAAWRDAWIERVCRDRPEAACLRITTERIATAEARRLLGQEFQVAVITGRALPTPDLLAIVSGTLCGGGLLVLATEPDVAPAGAFDRWLQTQLQQPSVLVLSEGAALPPLPATGCAAPLQPDARGCLTAGQARAVEGVLQVVHGHRRRPLVLTAERGRGKSSALGIAAAALLIEGRRRVLVTAPKRSAADALFERAAALLPDAERERALLRWHQGELRYLPPDQLLQQQPEADLLLVDEAAAIPAPLLEALLARYARIAFATTTCGYEGTGRGFDIRFRPHLSRHAPGWRRCELDEPVRWAAADPLESWLYQTLLLDAEPAQFDAPLQGEGEACRLECWRGDQLVADGQRLAELFALLVLAHYQTTPNDLRDLLQGEGMQVWLLLHRGRVAGGALTVREGGLPDALTTDVWLGQRRPPGHLLPQALISQSGWLEAGQLRYLRVIRIAVHPDLQRAGLGRLLLERLTQAGGDCDLLGSSFAASDHLPRFWAGAGFHFLRLGLQRDAASGCHSLLVARPLSDAGRALVARAESRFRDHFEAQLAGAYADLDPALVATLLQRGASPAWAPSEQDCLDLAAYVLGGRGFEQAEPVLQRLVLVLCQRGELVPGSGGALLIQRVLQRHRVERCCQSAGLSGRRALQQRLRNLLLPVVKEKVVPRLAPALRARVQLLLEDGRSD